MNKYAGGVAEYRSSEGKTVEVAPPWPYRGPRRVWFSYERGTPVQPRVLDLEKHVAKRGWESAPVSTARKHAGSPSLNLETASFRGVASGNTRCFRGDIGGVVCGACSQKNENPTPYPSTLNPKS